MGKSTRRIKRDKYLVDRKKAEKDLSEKVGMFDQLPDECTACTLAFDKKDKEMVKSWFVVVKNEQNVVNLYCPPCWENAQKMLNEFRKRVEGKINDNKSDF
jgi:hypothetical protein